MTPNLARSDLADRHRRHAEPAGGLLARHVRGSDPNYVGLGELGVGVSRPGRRSAAGDGFCHVLRVSSEVKVCGLHADGPVTFMEDVEPVSGAVVDSVGGDVGAHGESVQSEAPVRTADSPAGPVPAPFCRRLAGQEPREHLCLGREVWRAFPGAVAQGVPVLVPPLPVVAAQPSSVVFLAAVRDGAGSHSTDLNGLQR